LNSFCNNNKNEIKMSLSSRFSSLLCKCNFPIKINLIIINNKSSKIQNYAASWKKHEKTSRWLIFFWMQRFSWNEVKAEVIEWSLRRDRRVRPPGDLRPTDSNWFKSLIIFSTDYSDWRQSFVISFWSFIYLPKKIL